jgi:hypothetical protein
MWGDTIERIRQDPNASVFQVAFSSENEAKSALMRLSFSKTVTQGGMTGVAMPPDIVVKMGKTTDGTVWVLLGGPMTAEQSYEAHQEFSKGGREVMMALPAQVEARIKRGSQG